MTAVPQTDRTDPQLPGAPPAGPDLGRDPFWKLLDRTGVSVMVTDLEGRLEHVNRRFEETSGWTAEEVLGREPRFLKSGMMDDAVYADLWATIRSGSEWRGELCSRRKDGSLLWEEMTVLPVLDRAGLPERFVAVKEDIGERKFQEREQSALAELGVAFGAGLEDPEGTLVALLHRLFGADGVALLLPVTDAPGQMTIAAASGRWTSLAGSRVPADEGPVELVARTRQVYLGRVDPFDCSLHGVRASALGLPLCSASGSPIGSLWLTRRVNGTGATGFGSSDARLLGSLTAAASERFEARAGSRQKALAALRLGAMRRINRAITASADSTLVLSTLVEAVREQLGVDACSVRILNPHFRVLEYAEGAGFRNPEALRVPIRLGEGVTGAAALERRLGGSADRARELTSGDADEFLAREEFRAWYAVPLVASGRLIGALEVFHRSPLLPDAEWREWLGALAEQGAIALEHGRLCEAVGRGGDDLALAQDATVEAWVQALDRAGKESIGHIRRVTDLTVRVAAALGVPEADLVHVRRGALLHDIGKLAVPDAILQKPGSLTGAERGVVERHAACGSDWLRSIRFLRPALDIPWCHHERMDGSGYPRGLKGDQIPLAARIFAVVDMWDALNTDRVYCSAWPEEKVVDYLRSLSGVQLDPRVVETFLSLRPTA